MRILFVQPALPHYRVPFFMELQRRAQGEVQVWSDHHQPGLPFRDPEGAFRAVHHPELGVGPFLSQPALLRAVRDGWPDVVVLPWNTRYLQLTPALLEGRLRRKPVVLWGHGYSRRFSTWKHQARNAIGRLADACVTYSEPTRERLVAEGLDPKRVFCAPNALDGGPMQAQREYWRARPDELDDLRRHLEVGAARVVLFVSRLEPDKRVELLLEAITRLKVRVPDVQLVIVGDGTQREALRGLAERLGIAAQTRFLGAIYDERVLGAVFACASVFAYPVAVGLSILHALNYGVPVVTSDRAECHNPEFDVLSHDVNSLLYRHDDVDDLALRLERLLVDRQLRAHLSQGALKSVTGPEGRTLEHMAGGMMRALDFAISTKR